MAFDVILFSLSKNSNSTKQPVDSTGLLLNCSIRDSSSAYNPSFLFKFDLSINPVQYNYAKVLQFGRYYYITDWMYDRGLWWCSMTVDVLASFKDAIGASSNYILRSSAEVNGSIVDSTYPATAIKSIDNENFGGAWSMDDYFIVGVAGGSTSYFGFSSLANMQSFFDDITSDNYIDDAIGDDWQTLFPGAKMVANVMQYITGIMWFPFDPDLGGGSIARVGYVDVPSVGIEIDERVILQESITGTIRRHPQASSRGRYMNLSPYSEYYLYYPPFGRIQLDANIMQASDAIEMNVYVDLYTGGGMLQVSCDGFVLATVNSQIGQPYQYSATTTKGYSMLQLAGYATGEIASIAGAASGGAAGLVGKIPGLISNSVNAIGDAMASKIPQLTSVGGMGGAEQLEGDIFLQYIFHTIVDDDNTNSGAPLCGVRTISDIPGYVMCRNPDVDTFATLQEKEQIIQYMTGGFFYE